MRGAATDVAIPPLAIDPESCVDPVALPSPAVAEGDPSAEPQVAGRLSAELIRSLVRQHYGAFRLCYERGLGRNPELAGRVTIHFVIDRDGKVALARVGSNQLRDCQVTACIRDGFTQLEFPAPQGGIVTVVYPVNFQPE
ncbi:MAG TPA: AgmX/PglI C-terminal domain-containing protein [Polyangiaceae bacterium]|nr:AgmX/PglI C-terminal domain-containing protein [Polyangiaceae bacterium]